MCVGARKGGKMEKRKIRTKDDIECEVTMDKDSPDAFVKRCLMQLDIIEKREGCFPAPPVRMIKNAG